MYQEKPMSWEYIAGFFDADGSIQFHSKSSHVYIVISQKESEAAVLDEIKEFWQAQGMYVMESNSINKETNCYWTRISVGERKHVRKILNKLQPYLRNKACTAKKALKILDEKDIKQKQREMFCKYGHKRTPETTYINKKTGKKSCLTCRQIRGRGLQPVAPPIQ